MNVVFGTGRTELLFMVLGSAPTGDWVSRGGAVARVPVRQQLPFNSATLVGFGDTERRHVWIIDREAGRVVAALDLETNTYTGPFDPAPPWAELSGGVPLRRLDEAPPGKAQSSQTEN